MRASFSFSIDPEDDRKGIPVIMQGFMRCKDKNNAFHVSPTTATLLTMIF
jgi:hypothetical protein